MSSRTDAAATRPGGMDPATGVAIGFAVAGWALYALLGPLAVFITWYGDCLSEPCDVPGTLDQVAYAFDLLWWLSFPALLYFAYRRRQWAWAALVTSAIVLDIQLVAAMAGARGFQGFGFTLPAVALLTFGTGFGFVMTLPRFRDRPGSDTAGQLAGIGCLGLIVATIAFQGVLVGIGGPLVGIAVLVAIALFVIAIAAYANRDGRGSAGNRAQRRRR